MKYDEISKSISYLYKGYNALKSSSLDPCLRALIELRVSQINGCAYCCGLHSEEARKAGVPQKQLDLLTAWYASAEFSEKEKAALQWSEDLTRISANRENSKKALEEYYSTQEIVDLTACITLMNALNRLAIALKKEA